MWKIDKNRREWILKGTLAAAIVGVIVGDVWLRTCGFDGCPSPREIQAYNPDEGGRIFDRNGRLMGRLAIVRRLNVPIAQVPVHVRQAFIATEDRRFYQHDGVDWRGFIRASLRNIKSFGVREGFSTITMQAARNSFVVNQYKSRSLAKKLIELRVTKLMENALTKDQILQLYLNAIYMGNGVYGVEAASRDLFGKSVSQLSVTEAAMLAALPKAPSAYTPRRNPQRALARRNLVLSLMVREGYISQDRLPGLARSPLRIARDEWHPDDSDDSFALDAVRAITDSVLSAGEEDVADVTVYTTLDRSAQLAGDRSVKRHRPSAGFDQSVVYTVTSATSSSPSLSTESVSARTASSAYESSESSGCHSLLAMRSGDEKDPVSILRDVSLLDHQRENEVSSRQRAADCAAECMPRAPWAEQPASLLR